jgi:hypothetical protein
LEEAEAPDAHLGYAYRVLDIIRPLLGPGEIERWLARIHGDAPASRRVFRTRLELQLHALAGDWEALPQVQDEAWELARTACAPSLAHIAVWSEAMRLAAAGASEEALAKALDALAALDSYGERYMAARLLSHLLPLLDADVAGRVSQDLAARLESMGALASAAEVQAL